MVALSIGHTWNLKQQFNPNTNIKVLDKFKSYKPAKMAVQIKAANLVVMYLFVSLNNKIGLNVLAQFLVLLASSSSCVN